MFIEQNHLSFKDTINWGSYYTKPNLVETVFSLINKNIKNLNDFIILDTSCGYGSFLQSPNIINNIKIGADIDIVALQKAKEQQQNKTIYFYHNSLQNISRNQYQLQDDQKTIIVGNPPYNDKTSIIRNGIKLENNNIDNDIRTRDLGISFMLSYNKIGADYVCILHPLSYLIKKANFSLLGAFKQNYKLLDSVVISSFEFSQTSKGTAFPIVIALYKKNNEGMDYSFIENYLFKTKEEKTFKLKDFDFISNYISKYPNKNKVLSKDIVTNFWTLRDINALKRNKTFVEKPSSNTIAVTKDKLAYYCYVDIFKRKINHIPYYFGNSDVIIDKENFSLIKNIFINESLNHYSFLKNINNQNSNNNSSVVIDDYFKKLLGEHYVD